VASVRWAGTFGRGEKNGERMLRGKGRWKEREMKVGTAGEKELC
jgi:hypothetical protein